MKQVRLGQIAFARSGDKGSAANIGVIPRSPAAYAVIGERLTARRVEEYFRSMGATDVRRYDWPSLMALNFVLPGVLPGGGSRSPRIDAQGKALGQALLEMSLEVPDDLPTDPPERSPTRSKR